MEVEGFTADCENAGLGCDKECPIYRLRKDDSLGELKYESPAGTASFYIMCKKSGACNTVTVIVSDTDFNRHPKSCRFTAASEGPDEDAMIKHVRHTVNDKQGIKIDDILSRYLKK